MPMKLMKPSSYLPLPSKHTALLLKKSMFQTHPLKGSPRFFFPSLFFSANSYLPPQAISYSTIHRSTTSEAPTTTMARVTCLITCSMRLLLQEAWSPLQMSSSRRFPSGRKAKYKCIYMTKTKPKRGSTYT